MTDPNNTAFPVRTDCISTDGLSKREYFAAMAMQGFISADPNGLIGPRDLAKCAIRVADELINALNEAQ